MPDLHLLGRTLRRTLPRLALIIHGLVLAALTGGPVTLPAVVGCAGNVLLTTLLIVAESRQVESDDDVEDLSRVVGALRTELADAYTDPVTGLPVRAVAERRLARARAAGEPVTVAVLDVDDMHGINDAYGHPGGDAYLAAIAWLLTNTAHGDGAADTIARLGGDEFIVISTRPPHTVAAALSGLLSVVIPVGHRMIPVRCSAGVHHTDSTGGGDPDTVLGCADLAMYTAKRHGGGVRVYDATRDGTPPADGGRPPLRSRDRSSALPADPDPAAPAGTSGRHARTAATDTTAAAAPPTEPSAGPSPSGLPVPMCWQCGTPSAPVPGGVRRCPRCGAGLVHDDVDGWISPAGHLHRRRAEADARRVAVSARLVGEALPGLVPAAPAGWSVAAAAFEGALHSVAVHPPAGSVDATAYLSPDTDHASTDLVGWTVRVHHRGQGIDFPLYTDGGARAARFRTATDALAAAVQALRIEIAAEDR